MAEEQQTWIMGKRKFICFETTMILSAILTGLSKLDSADFAYVAVGVSAIFFVASVAPAVTAKLKGT